MKSKSNLTVFTSYDTDFLMQSNITFSNPDEQGFCYVFQYREIIGIATQELVDNVEEMYSNNNRGF